MNVTGRDLAAEKILTATFLTQVDTPWQTSLVDDAVAKGADEVVADAVKVVEVVNFSADFALVLAVGVTKESEREMGHVFPRTLLIQEESTSGNYQTNKSGQAIR
jgi:hypothetical protein